MCVRGKSRALLPPPKQTVKQSLAGELMGVVGIVCVCVWGGGQL